MILFLHCEDRSAKYKSGNLVAVFPIRVTIRQQDMEPDGGGKRKGMNGGRSALARWRSALGVEQPSQRTERPAVERAHKSNKRLCQNSQNSGGLIKWADLSPLCQQAFRDEVAAPVLVGWKAFDGRYATLDSIAPIAWEDLGPNFGVAFQARHQRETRERQFGIRSDILVHPERDATNPANDPCPHCHVFGGLAGCGCELADE